MMPMRPDDVGDRRGTTRVPLIRILARRDPRRTVQDIMRAPVEVRPHDSVEEALRLAIANDLDRVLVTLEGRLLGVVSRWELATVDPALKVTTFLRQNVATVNAQTTVGEAEEIFRDHAPECLVVVLRGIAGVVTRRDVRAETLARERIEDDGPYVELGGSG
jgi:CBS domain-containing protein